MGWVAEGGPFLHVNSTKLLSSGLMTGTNDWTVFFVCNSTKISDYTGLFSVGNEADGEHLHTNNDEQYKYQ